MITTAPNTTIPCAAAVTVLADELRVDSGNGYSGTEAINLTPESYGCVLQTNSSSSPTCFYELEQTPSAGVLLNVPFHPPKIWKPTELFCYIPIASDLAYRVIHQHCSRTLIPVLLSQEFNSWASWVTLNKLNSPVPQLSCRIVHPPLVRLLRGTSALSTEILTASHGQA